MARLAEAAAQQPSLLTNMFTYVSKTRGSASRP
jgi:hypothetical protein